MGMPGSHTFIILYFWKLATVFYKKSSGNTKYLRADKQEFLSQDLSQIHCESSGSNTVVII